MQSGLIECYEPLSKWTSVPGEILGDVLIELKGWRPEEIKEQEQPPVEEKK